MICTSAFAYLCAKWIKPLQVESVLFSFRCLQVELENEISRQKGRFVKRSNIGQTGFYIQYKLSRKQYCGNKWLKNYDNFYFI